MPTPQASVRSINDWLKELDAVRLPVSRAHHEAVRRALLDGRKSLRDIAERMQDSPTIALAVLREANRNAGSFGEPAESLELALNRLGIKRVESLLEQMPVQDDAQIPLPLQQLQLISLHASQQANGLFAGRLARLWQEIHWGSLLFLAPLWPLVASQPTLFEDWERRVLGRGEPALKVERELLGTSLLPLCLALAEHWRLPEWIIQGYRLLIADRRQLIKALHIAHANENPLHQQQKLDADPSLRRWLTLPGNSVLLANGLALSSHHNWSCEHHLRWQRLAGLYLQTAVPELQQLIHQQAVVSARHHSRPQLWHPAQALLWPWECCRLRSQPPESDAPKPSQSEWKLHCSRLLTQPSPFANVLQLTECASQALHCSGMQRVLILLTDRNHTRLFAQQALGLPESAHQLRLDPAQSQVLRKLLTEAGQLRLSPANLAQVSALLPGSIKALFNGEHLLLRSLAHNGRVAMLVIADQGGGEFGAIQLQAFSKTMQCIERALSHFARRNS